MAFSLNDIKKLSPQAKALIIILIIFIIGYLDWFFFLSDAMEKKTSLDKKLEEMQGQIKEKEKIAIQINKYMADVESLKENYKIALQKLPDQREIPGLFHSVALAGKDAGIEFLLFEPKAAVPKTLSSEQKQTDSSKTAPADGKKNPTPQQEPFYEEIPVEVTVMGTFQNILYFFEKVAKLPRIVNISDISMGDRKDVKGRGYVITASCTIKTYMFIDKKEKVSEKTK